MFVFANFISGVRNTKVNEVEQTKPFKYILSDILGKESFVYFNKSNLLFF